MKLHRMLERLIIALFVLVLAVPFVATVVGIDTSGTAEENREPAPFPTLEFIRYSVARWPAEFSRYFSDHFAFRSHLVRWQARFRLRVLRTSPSPDVILGHDDWLFYGTSVAMDDYSVSSPVSEEDLDAWRDTLQHTQDWLEGQGVTYLFVIAPDKHAIYPELMPNSIRRIGAVSHADQLVRHLRDHSSVSVLDLHDPLEAAKAFDRLYHRTDTHWNDRGALVAYQEIVERLGSPGGMRPLLRSDFEPRQITVPGMDLAAMLGLQRVLREDDLRLVPRAPREARVVEPAVPDPWWTGARIVTERPGALPRAVVFRDSFGSALIPFLSEHFSRAVYLWQNDIDTEVISAEHPNVVIQEWVGRRIGLTTPYDAVAAAPGSRQFQGTLAPSTGP